MKETASIQILQPVEAVFDMVTDPNRVHEWAQYVRRIEILSRGAWGGYDQARYILVRGNLEIESIETVIKYERPTLFASKTHILRTTRIYNEPTNDSLPPIGEIDFPEKLVVEKSFEIDQKTILVQMDFIPEGENSMTLSITTFSHLGFLASIVIWIGRIFRRNPYIKTLEDIKKAAENTLANCSG